MSAPLNGLLLAGGKSRRMGSDKADLVLADGLSLRDQGLKLLNLVTEETYLSTAGDDRRTYHCNTIPDLRHDAGPLAGLEAAFARAPEAAWLVTACDLPFLTSSVLKCLREARDPGREATCFISRFDGKPEPLCTIYEPASAKALSHSLSEKAYCARRFLSSLDRRELDLPEKSALDNCNRPEDLQEARIALENGRSAKTIVVEYCGVLREDAGMSDEEVHTESATAAGLWEELRMSRGLSLELDAVRIAINDEFQSWNHPLANQDKLTLFPPFSGG
ncbi:MAG: NTP transferase domain-containing protein [Verrucomicrobiota bacterium]|nr:NTP transferase domain-containing protein [Verrucomicrobiota bacterium]